MRNKVNVIEVEVRGSCGIGKSEALEVIAKALNDFYRAGSSTVVAGKLCDGAISDAKITGQTAKNKNTVFFLSEKMPGQA